MSSKKSAIMILAWEIWKEEGNPRDCDYFGDAIWIASRLIKKGIYTINEDDTDEYECPDLSGCGNSFGTFVGMNF